MIEAEPVLFEKCWEQLLGKPLNDIDYWIKECRIPLGTLMPYSWYEGDIPMTDIVSIPFDPSDMSSASRRALNVLILGASGDGKSLIMKLIWYILHYAGYYCGYIDPAKTHAGRARKGWSSNRLAPYLKAKGINLQHWMPVWSMKKKDHLAHNFMKYSTRLEKINQREMWQGLGMTNVGASKTTKIIKKMDAMGWKPTIEKIRGQMNNLSTDEITQGSIDAVNRVLVDVEDYQVVDEEVPVLNLFKEWQKGDSIVISYNQAEKALMTFDIGMKIKESADSYYEGRKKPVMWFLDDSSFYAKKFENVKYNFAVDEIIDIGFNYRGLGVNNVMAVQSLGVIDENVAETYKIKLISPLFTGVKHLTSINIPKKAIDYLRRDDLLVTDRSRHLMQWLLIDEEKNVVAFFPFTPPCTHFSEVYFEKKREDNDEKETQD